METVSFRLATENDVDRLVEIVTAEPGVEAMALMGSVELALRYDEGLLRLNPIPNTSRVTVLALRAGRVVGFLQYEYGRGRPHSRVEVVRFLLSLLGPIGLLSRLPGLWARTRVDIPIPTGSFHIANLDVEVAARGQGIGTQLLDHAEHEARRLGARRMSLITRTTNSTAIRLYERNGFVTTRTATHPSYEHHTGLSGRMLMEKDLSKRPK
ncbi:MAG: GNAT family N-acetyltransferase [Acidimicrobiia bacterium]